MNNIFPDLVIFIPGIGGSTLVRGTETLWGGSWGPLLTAFRRGELSALAIENDDVEKDNLGDDVHATNVIDGFQIIPGLWKIEAYGGFGRLLSSSVGLNEHGNYLMFPYDWRRDNRVSARALARFAEEKLAAWRVASNNVDAKLILIGHSMGGLVARYYVECLGGWRDVRRLFTLGTPHRGSLNALGFLANGFSKKIGPLSVDATKPLRSFASVHQLLPTYPCILQAGELRRVNEAGVPNLDINRVEAAAAFHREIAEAAQINGREVGYPHNYLVAIVSKRQPTFQSAEVTASGVDLFGTINGEDLGGDGTVPAVSAVPIGMDLDLAKYVWGLHSSLCNQEAVQEHLISALQSRRVDQDRFRTGTQTAEVRLALEDAYQANVPFKLAAEVINSYEQKLDVSTLSANGHAGPGCTLFRDGDRFRGMLTLPQGAWRVRVQGRRTLGVEDLTLVI